RSGLWPAGPTASMSCRRISPAGSTISLPAGSRSCRSAACSGPNTRERRCATTSACPGRRTGIPPLRRRGQAPQSENGYCPPQLQIQERPMVPTSAPRIVLVPPTHAPDIADIAKTIAPSGFELVVSRPERPALEQVLPPAEYLVCYPNVQLD